MCKEVGKCILIIINVLVLLVSIVLVVVGAILQWGDPNTLTNIVPNMVALSGGGNSTGVNMAQLSQLLTTYVAVLGNSGLIIFIIGIILLVISACGLFGVCCTNRVLLAIYLILTSIIWILIVIFVIVFFVKRSTLQIEGQIAFTQALQKYSWSNGSGVNTTAGSGIIDLIQARLTCCGVLNGSDYVNVAGYNTSYGIIPFSCCVMTSTYSFTPKYSNCTTNPSVNNSYYNNGCYSGLWSIIQQYSTYAGIALVVLAAILLILIIIAAVLLRNYGKE